MSAAERRDFGQSIRVIYLAGAQNSGSTLLDTILGAAPGAFSLGEVGGFHRYPAETSCDCGEPPAACDPCRAVVSALAADGELASFLRLAPTPLKEHRLHWLLVPTRARARYARLADRVLAAVADETGCRTLIDSSKNVGRAAALVHDSRHDVRVIHIVRDGRGYLDSRRRRAAAGGRRHVAPLAMAAWLGKNLLVSEVLRRSLPGNSFLRCRYEDLVSDAEAELRRIGEFAGVATGGLSRAVTEDGLPRHHLFEPPRRADYSNVRLDPGRLRRQRLPPVRNLAYWVCGGFLSRRWGYHLQQSYLRRPERAPSP